ncbi:MAG: hypothetical protein K2K25_07690 [Muribaculaceae bacterium]|nr:hypothetical protein [Muribaculaceae bacterium]
MRISLLLAGLMAVCFSSFAKDTLKGRVLCEGDNKPVPCARIVAEYPDSIVNYEADRKGRFCFSPLSFPVTITAQGEGMHDATIGLLSMPASKVLILLEPDPAAPKVEPKRRVDWSSTMQPRLRSTFTVRNK